MSQSFLHIKLQHSLIAFAMLLLSAAAFAEEPVVVTEEPIHQSLKLQPTMQLGSTVAVEEPAGESYWSRIEDTLSRTWQSNNYELYIPVNVWHNRHYYSKEKIDSYNENPWGLGIGKYRFDDGGDWHALYTMVFLDSHDDWEPIIGYGFQKIWRPADGFRLGAGYTVGLTIRKDYDYVPIPVIAPIASVEYKKFAVQSTYILGSTGNGNILFTWLRWQLQ